MKKILALLALALVCLGIWVVVTQPRRDHEAQWTQALENAEQRVKDQAKQELEGILKELD